MMGKRLRQAMLLSFLSAMNPALYGGVSFDLSMRPGPEGEQCVVESSHFSYYPSVACGMSDIANPILTVSREDTIRCDLHLDGVLVSSRTEVKSTFLGCVPRFGAPY